MGGRAGSDDHGDTSNGTAHSRTQFHRDRLFCLLPNLDPDWTYSFLYHYLPSVYIGYLALAAILADMWHGEAETWESFAILLSIMPVLIVGVGHIAGEYQLVSGEQQVVIGLLIAAVLLISYVLLISCRLRADRFVYVAFLSVAVILFVYYLPIWLGIPISRTGYYARMWFQGPGLRNWI